MPSIYILTELKTSLTRSYIHQLYTQELLIMVISGHANIRKAVSCHI